jgi:RNA polymerase sigma-B factor
VLPGQASRVGGDLAGLDDGELLGIVGSQPRSSRLRMAACELLVGRYDGLVRSCVRRYPPGPEPTEDLMQAGYVGLVKAISNFDPAAGRNLGAYAHAYITGEIKRHFRDKRWPVHVTRPVKELAMEIRAATWPLTQELGRTPADSDLARHLGVSPHDLQNARLAEKAFQPSSLEAPQPGQPGHTSLADLLGEEDPHIEHMLGMQALATHWHELPPREQHILLLRFYGGMTQAQVGQHLGLSQMHVSRLLTHALSHLRHRLTGTQDSHPPQPASQTTPDNHPPPQNHTPQTQAGNPAASRPQNHPPHTSTRPPARPDRTPHTAHRDHTPSQPQVTNSTKHSRYPGAS